MKLYHPFVTFALVLRMSSATGYVFKRVDKLLSWDNHVAAANGMGCWLASIRNGSKQDEVEALFSDSIDTRIWIGASRTGPGPTDWEWIDGAPFQCTHWQRGEPNNNAEDGALMDTRPIGERYWNDVWKGYEYAAVYKCPTTAPTGVTTPAPTPALRTRAPALAPTHEKKGVCERCEQHVDCASGRCILNLGPGHPGVCGDCPEIAPIPKRGECERCNQDIDCASGWCVFHWGPNDPGICGYCPEI